jgi:hypothetical protein
MNPIMSNVGEQSMSTPNPRHCKLEGLALYAPRRARKETATAEERWRAKLDRIAAAIASVEAIEAERGLHSSMHDTFRAVEVEHDVGSSTFDIVEALDAEQEVGSGDGSSAPDEAEHDVRSDVGGPEPRTVEVVEAQHHAGSSAPDTQESISLAAALHTPRSPSSSGEVADWPGLSIEERTIDSGAPAHDQLLHCRPRDPATRPQPPIRTQYPAAPPLFARISLVIGAAAMATFGLTTLLTFPSDGHSHKNAGNNLVVAQAAGAPNGGTRVAARGPRQDRANSSIRGDSTTPSIEPLNSEQAALLLQRGRDLLKAGNVADARLAFQVLADRGDAEAALALATTFDQRAVVIRNAVGVAADDARARAWYRRAMELGSSEAKRALIQMATQ